MRVSHRPQARAARLGAALRLPAEDAPQRRAGLSWRWRRAVRHRRRPERARLQRAGHRAAAGDRGIAAGRPPGPALAGGLSTLFRDLGERGLLAWALVVGPGGFGRAPRINANAGRDHWGPAFTVALAGGGIKGGRVLGRSDARAERPASTPYGPED